VGDQNRVKVGLKSPKDAFLLKEEERLFQADPEDFQYCPPEPFHYIEIHLSMGELRSLCSFLCKIAGERYELPEDPLVALRGLEEWVKMAQHDMKGLREALLQEQELSSQLPLLDTRPGNEPASGE
jgi:hypothetical protein